MANFFRCKDGHRCENGSLCTEDPNDEGSYYCDCSAAKGNFAGLYCEFEGDNDCEFPQEVSTTWFCTNQGTCALGVASDKSQWTCDCPDEYEGPHCEFIKGAVPGGWPGINQSTSGIKQKGGGIEVWIMAIIILVSMVVVGLIGLFIVKKQLHKGPADVGENAPKDQSEALNLELDGEVLREAVQAQYTNSTDHYDPDAMEGVPSPMQSELNGTTQYKDKPEKRNGAAGFML